MARRPQDELSEYEIKNMTESRFEWVSVNGHPPEKMKPKEAAAYLRITPNALWRGARLGRFPSLGYGWKGQVSWFYRRRDLDAFLKSGVVACYLPTPEYKADLTIRLAGFKKVELAKLAKRRLWIDSLYMSKPQKFPVREPPPPSPSPAKEEKAAAVVDGSRVDQDGRPHLPPIMTLPEAAAYLRVTKSTVTKLAEKGELPGKKVGSQWRFARASLEKLFGSDEVSA